MKARKQNIDKIRWIDGAMRRFITIGGVGCLGIFVFLFIYLFWQVKPLLSGSDWAASQLVSLDDWDGYIYWEPRFQEGSVLLVEPEMLRLLKADGSGQIPLSLEPGLLSPGERFTAATYEPVGEQLWLGSSLGNLFIVSSASERISAGEGTLDVYLKLSLIEGEISGIDPQVFLEKKSAIVSARKDETDSVYIVSENPFTSPLELGDSGDDWDFSKIFSTEGHRVESIAMSGNQQYVYLHQSDSSLKVLKNLDGKWATFLEKKNVIPFGFGEAGKVLVFKYAETETLNVLELGGRSLDEPQLVGAAQEYSFEGSISSWSQDAKTPASLLVQGNSLKLLNLRLARMMGAFELDASIESMRLDFDEKRMWALDQKGYISLIEFTGAYLDYYHGSELMAVDSASSADVGWQPAVASPQVQPGFDLTPLILGTLKGTLLALTFATPFAIMSAIYTSQFARSRLRNWIKPCVELIGSFPSVVLGFICAFWLSSYIEAFFTELLCFVVMLPLILLFLMRAPFRLPGRLIAKTAVGADFYAMSLVLIFSIFGAWILGNVVDALISSFGNMHVSGGDSLLDWLEISWGVNYEQRNALAVAVILGFATIPFMYSLMDSAFAQVPRDLILASLSLGASRFQMVVSVLLPAALPGILGAFLISTSRCLGETMIFVMVSGNTPTGEFDLFEGFKALSATLAIELSEARVESTLYRTLFLAAWVLLCLSFVANTSAALLRRYYERRYKGFQQGNAA